ncbi:MAG: hypothetical protein M0D57_08700 [Sphingobacteriales bacterium JAD_PAG50586_3]|nr:MAG: hypothetical protein M0D57_08700 [Sphingobacteriales bacterium JAD_PAG50586_3]
MYDLCGCNAVNGWAIGCKQVVIGGQPNYGTLTAANETLCYVANPSLINFSTPVSGGSGIYTYQWYYQDGLATCPTGNSTTGWTIISNATSPTYDPSNLTTTRTYACMVTMAAGGTCIASNNWASGCRQVSVLSPLSYGTLTTGNETICYLGDPANITFASLPAGGSGVYTYQWYSKAGINTCLTGTLIPSDWLPIAGATGTSYDPPTGITGNRTYACYVTAAAGLTCAQTSAWATDCRKVTILGPATFGTLNYSDATYCSTADPAAFSFATAPSGGSGNFTYQWYYQDGLALCPSGSSTTGWTLISGATAATYDAPAGLTNSRTYACYVTVAAGSGCLAGSLWANSCCKITIVPAANFGSLPVYTESFCTSGDPTNISFETAPTGGNGIFSYQWYYKAGVNACPSGSSTSGWIMISGETSASYNPTTISASRTYACFITANGCTGTSGWANNCRQILINGTVSYGALASGNESVCPGGDPNAISFSTPVSGGSGVYAYQWYYQDGLVTCPSGTSTTGWSLISGATSATYNPPTGLANNRTYACFVNVTAYQTCTASSAWATGCRQGNNIINNCFWYTNKWRCIILRHSRSAKHNILYIPIRRSGVLSYKWYYQDAIVACPTGTSTAGWTLIPGATNSNHNPAAGLTNSRTYACFVTYGGVTGCAADSLWATSCRKITVNPAAAFGTLTSANQSFCSSGDPANITFTTIPSGGSGSFTYQWYYQNGIIPCPSGSSTTGWTIISGATTSSYDPPSALTQSRTYACLVTGTSGGGCSASTGWATNCRQVTISNTVAYGTLAAGNESICSGGDPAAISFATIPSGGSGTYTYQWYYQNGIITCPSGSSTTGWTIISGATTATYDPPSGVTQTRTYACLVTATADGGCTASTAWATGCRQLTISPAATFGTLASGNQSLCSGGDPANISFATVPSGGSSSFTYQWYYQDGLITCPTGGSTAGWTIISGGTTSSYDPPSGLSISRTYACLVTATAGGGCTATTNWASQCRQGNYNTGCHFWYVGFR